jgi:anthranilate phosphoribosyltransferase
VIGGRARDLNDGMEIAARSIDSGEAARRLDLLIKISNA